MEPKPFVVKKHGIAVPVTVVSGGYRVDVRDHLGHRHRHTYKTPEKARAKAAELAGLVASNSLDMASLNPQQLAVAREAVRLGLTLDDVRRARENQVRETRTVTEVADEMIAAKMAAAGDTDWLVALDSRFNTLRSAFGHADISGVLARDIEHCLATNSSWSQRTVSNHRSAAVQLWAWARDRGYLPDRKTEAAKTEPVVVRAPEIRVYSPEDIVEVIGAVHPMALPWVLIGGFAGVRSEEIRPTRRSRKSPLDWSDIDLDNREIRLRPETAKGREGRKKGRLIPVAENLFEMLQPLWKKSGPVCDFMLKRAIALLKDEGKPYRHNGLRKSFATYRTAVVQNPQQVALEMGNSAPVLNLHYRSPEARRAGEEWFRIVV